MTIGSRAVTRGPGPVVRTTGDPVLSGEVVRGRAAFAAMAAEWDRLADQDGRGLPFLRHDFLGMWIDHFATDPESTLEVHTVRSGSTLVAALPFLRESPAGLGPLIGEDRVGTCNAHSCRFDVLARPGPEGQRAVQQLWIGLRDQPEVSRWLLSDVPDDGRAAALVAAARADGFAVGTWPSLDSPYVELASCEGRPEALEARLSSKLKANLRRRWKNLAGRGNVEVVRHPGLDRGQLEALLSEGLGLERAGWKGRRGTAILSDERVEGFYRQLATEWDRQGCLRLYALRLDGRAVAFHFGATRDRRYFLLKPAYAEAHADCSPGQLLMREVLFDLVREGITELDFLGPMMPWKRDWTALSRPHSWIYIDRPHLVGRLRHQWKFGVKPAVRRWWGTTRKEWEAVAARLHAPGGERA
jgi:CelD/BcsL family acetyltransferase involved in cellulose biosynthesis